MTPILKYSDQELFKIKDNLIEVVKYFEDYIIFEKISDREMRRHPSLQRLSSKELYNVIERTSQAKIKTHYPLRVLKGSKYKSHFGWFNLLNADNCPWSHIFKYRLLSEERKRT